ncbi:MULTISPECIES: branched-chain amino acid ABC transporter substrate-binding protein [Ureibacillus]|jgi:branched-chain amino acid transport system substrate-binding protein|uniref:Branched-chain amino acid transport system substrate-binding protein n=1 Tax=Ureibacillus thermosphaericus TaxID=51173 RepID=A0A840PS43_URETH|nr:branched-chain amino acid ABC transporter substrate-binding protein [Ureibacillus thermosphaericus]MBB5148720.1 branched-chain amino acid transport system substrate-binding protein [Ureibacillus thermosphaericus]NKZ31439.1 branched-chain amino acid ABC transporter substrate-binding protein [Ureibacillus thermosphaericus]
MKKLLVVFASALLLVILSACSQSSSNQSGQQTTTEQTGANSNVIKIATHTPLSGGNAIIGEAIKLGAQMKLEEEASRFEEMGFTLQLEPYDDQADPKKGVSNANLIGADDAIYGVIGHFNSGVTIPSSEIYEKYNITMVNPGSTATDVTDRGLKTVNRIVARDDFQGPAGAQFAVNELGAKRIFVIQDKTAYGTGIADAFVAEAEKLGAEIVGYEGITVGEKDYNGVINQALNKKPDLIFFGGIYSEGGIIIKQARDKGINVPIMGGDGMDSSGLVDIAGEAVKNVYITSVAGDTSSTPEGKKFMDDYKAKFNKEAEAFSAYGYDAMGVFLQGLENAIKANGGKLPPKEAVVEAVRAITDYQGVITDVSFDEKGDNKNAKVYLYKFEEAKYPASYVGEVSQ